MADRFSPDADIQKVASAYAEDAVEFSAKYFQLKLDVTDASIVQVEGILNVLHQQAQEHQPEEEKLQSFAKKYGGYVGEVYRRSHGATWGMARVGALSIRGCKRRMGSASSGLGRAFSGASRTANRKTSGTTTSDWHRTTVQAVHLRRRGPASARTSCHG